MRTDRQTDRRMDMKKLILAFRNFANAPKSNEKGGRYGRGMKGGEDKNTKLFGGVT
jgi:hypothetical protein